VPPLARWAEAGESRVVLAAATARLRAAAQAARQRGAVSAAVADTDVEAAVRELDAARFAGATPSHAAELLARAASLVSALDGAGAAP